MTDHLITPDDLAKLIDASTVRILDVRWRLDRPDGRPDYLAGHIPGAVYVDLDTELAAHGDPGEGRHPLPSVEALQASARSWGINDGDTVVVYDDLKSMSAARAWWLLRYAGMPDVRVLDGSLGGWAASGRSLESGAVTPDHGAVTLSYGHLPVLSIDDAAAMPESGILLDARAGERYRGEVEPVDPRAGHIPGAISAPTGENVDDDGRFLPADALRARFNTLGAELGAINGAEHNLPSNVGVYCGSGVTAAHQALALTLAGFAPAVYPGSWSQWSNTPGRPVATGERE
ncbi:MAG: thiosulfate/3-mercaptopyruvate sulfurtransferase [Actinomycetota bacterium]|jgi:thiosulfate/3-mercaptopyruvate sulfurtransferase|nr:rhodanese-related sulfurtransferase [Glaciihabitans sp.]MDQ1544766.1 thiosulfate/3-mercaptopyruvate sulfurtransferase [Actinomycetota bacterium]MDQ1560837.1 thiosulfate/3-mercaptopyruvate sulfurtransferase [Actinomycetota bacterium]MDQ1574363.1 thiosulfate/3-mercaptopyruvate sulfurtransferase [Actinomycetota bacterium]